MCRVTIVMVVEEVFFGFPCVIEVGVSLLMA